MKALTMFISSTGTQAAPAGEIPGAFDQGQGRPGARARTVTVTQPKYTKLTAGKALPDVCCTAWFEVHPLGWTGRGPENWLTDPGFRGESPWLSIARIRSNSSDRSSSNSWLESRPTRSPSATASAAI